MRLDRRTCTACWQSVLRCAAHQASRGASTASASPTWGVRVEGGQRPVEKSKGAQVAQGAQVTQGTQGTRRTCSVGLLRDLRHGGLLLPPLAGSRCDIIVYPGQGS